MRDCRGDSAEVEASSSRCREQRAALLCSARGRVLYPQACQDGRLVGGAARTLVGALPKPLGAGGALQGDLRPS